MEKIAQNRIIAYMSKLFNNVGTEFSILLTVAFSLLAFGFISPIVIEIILTISLFVFFAFLILKFVIYGYKESMIGIAKANNCANHYRKVDSFTPQKPKPMNVESILKANTEVLNK